MNSFCFHSCFIYIIVQQELLRLQQEKQQARALAREREKERAMAKERVETQKAQKAQKEAHAQEALHSPKVQTHPAKDRVRVTPAAPIGGTYQVKATLSLPTKASPVVVMGVPGLPIIK